MESSCGAESKLTDGANSKVARRRVGERECLCEDLLSNPRIPREGFALTDGLTDRAAIASHPSLLRQPSLRDLYSEKGVAARSHHAENTIQSWYDEPIMAIGMAPRNPSISPTTRHGRR
jgi:hypothetical protein